MQSGLEETGKGGKCIVSGKWKLTVEKVDIFPEGTQTLADVLYYARQEQSNIGTVLTTIVRHSENLDYIVPMPVSEDIKEIDSGRVDQADTENYRTKYL